MSRREEERGTSGAEGAVARIVYASQASAAGPVYREMERIRASALRHNAPAGVATALLYQSGWFVQWREGPLDQVLGIMDRVSVDPRHHDLRIVHRSRGPRLLSGPWSMAIVQCRDTRLQMQERVLHLKRQVDAGRQFAPPAIWRRLSTPMQHPGALRQEDPDAFQRVLVCSAAGTASFDLVNWLAARYRAEIVRRRFAGAQAPDVGTNYVDFEQGGRVLRVIAMARNGLAVPLTQAFLADYSHAVLLLSADPQANLQLMERVLRTFATLPHQPALIGVGSAPGMHLMVARLARRFHLRYQAAVADPHESEWTWHAVEPVLAAWLHAANSGNMARAAGQ